MKPTIKKKPNSESDSKLDDPISKNRLPKLPMVNHGEIKNEVSQEEYDYIIKKPYAIVPEVNLH